MQKIDSVGRITIPKNIRERYNLEKGTEYELLETDRGLVVSPKSTPFTIGEEDMKALRKLYIMLSNSGFIDEYYNEILSRVTKRTDMNCTECGEYLFLTSDNNYKCFNCE